MEKKAYITPEVVIEDIELEATMQGTSNIPVVPTDPEDDFYNGDGEDNY